MNYAAKIRHARPVSFLVLGLLGLVVATTADTQEAHAQTYYSYPSPGSLCAVENGPGTGGTAQINMGQIANVGATGHVYLDCPVPVNGSSLGSVVFTGWSNASSGASNFQLCNTSASGTSGTVTCGSPIATTNIGVYSVTLSDRSAYNPANYNYLRVYLAPSTGSGYNDLYGYTIQLTAQ